MTSPNPVDPYGDDPAPETAPVRSGEDLNWEVIKTKYKSVRSPTASPTHLVFAHIRDSRKELKKQIFEFRLHLIRHDSTETKSLKLYPKDESAKLEMEWIDKSKIQIRYHNGKTETFDLKKYAPTLF